MIEIFRELAPIFGPVAALFIVISAILYTDNRQLRKERNESVAKKDEDLKESNDKVIEIHEETLNTLSAINEETRLRAAKEEAKTDAIIKTLEGINAVLLSIKK